MELDVTITEKRAVEAKPDALQRMREIARRIAAANSGPKRLRLLKLFEAALRTLER